jgi:hypothetical protein
MITFSLSGLFTFPWYKPSAASKNSDWNISQWCIWQERHVHVWEAVTRLVCTSYLQCRSSCRVWLSRRICPTFLLQPQLSSTVYNPASVPRKMKATPSVKPTTKMHKMAHGGATGRVRRPYEATTCPCRNTVRASSLHWPGQSWPSSALQNKGSLHCQTRKHGEDIRVLN